MQKEELKSKILKVIKSYPVGSVGTIKEGKPWVRYMVMQPEENLVLYTTSFAASRKIAQIKDNNNVHVAFGADSKNLALPYLNVEGTADVLTDIVSKKKCWSDMLSQFFKGPEDPNYVVIKVTPRIIEYWEADTHESVTYTFE